MDNKTKMAIGTAVIAAGAALAMPASAQEAVPVATSYADLLDAVPNAGERLVLADAQYDAQAARFQEAQYAQPMAHHHHHHHHHHHDRRWYMQNGYYWHGGRWMLRPVHHHHHHHHHDHY